MAGIEHQSIQTGQGIGGNETAPPLDDIALVVVVGGLDQLDEESLLGIHPYRARISILTLPVQLANTPGGTLPQGFSLILVHKGIG
jgi:hypothetical protein